VHPQADHWLTDGEPLPIPGLMVTAGISSKVDVSAYLTKNVQSNYGLWGGQLQYNLVNDRPRQFAASARLSLVSLYGPADIDMMVSGLDLTASKTFALGRRISFSPYAEVSTVLTRAHETSAVVNLKDEYTQGYMGTLGAVAKLSVMRLAVEYSAATVNAVSFKVGFDF
jgi:hypothetical protein